ncbi:MAG: 50S ribosomal protein L5 [Candidatus Bathyarchaeota archaeon]|nr:MAG: 50S ribosomal protein L5 [Candidatus Bathyarchaeota archaeon]
MPETHEESKDADITIEETKALAPAEEDVSSIEPEEEPDEPEEAEEPDEKPPEEEAEVKPRRRTPIGTRSIREIMIGKVVVNITAGESGEPLDRAMTILENITGQRPCTRRAKQTIRTWGIRRNEPISCMVTLRGERAERFLRNSLAAIRNRINPRSFDTHGNFAFGIREHIDIPGQRYDPQLGIIGMDVMVTVEKPGYRVARRRRARSRVGHSHCVTRDEAIEFMKQRFGLEVGLPIE